VCLLRYPLLPPNDAPPNILFGYDFYDPRTIDGVKKDLGFLEKFKRFGKNIQFLLAYDMKVRGRIQQEFGKYLPAIFTSKSVDSRIKLQSNVSIEMAESLFKICKFLQKLSPLKTKMEYFELQLEYEKYKNAFEKAFASCEQ
jgi:hypothetical protein